MIQWLHFTYCESDYIYISKTFPKPCPPILQTWSCLVWDNCGQSYQKIITYNGILKWFEVNRIQWLKHMWCMGR
jgi:hypothetical protein